ncbi:MAG: protein kinase, partial [Planctomycetota bacterium]|nr:protein kinase [Planctomycetota bacterium]
MCDPEEAHQVDNAGASGVDRSAAHPDLVPEAAKVSKGKETRILVEQFRRRHRTSLLTLLFTDLVGSTKLKQTRGDSEAVAAMQAHASVVRTELREFAEAQEISTAGDSFFCLFLRPSDAVAFALRIQHRTRTEFTPTFNISMRVGIHLGEVVIEERKDERKPLDLFGLQVDTAARVMSLSEGDQVLTSRMVFDSARQVLRSRTVQGLGNLVWLSHGQYAMKGVEEPIEICEVGEEGKSRLTAPGPSEKARPAGMSEEELGWRPAPDQAVPGTEWVLDDVLGKGGFGEVWNATHRRTKERRVFKFCFMKEKVRSLKRELALFRLLKEKSPDHPNIVRLHDVFLDSPPYYLAMEYVPGRSLRQWLLDADRLHLLSVDGKCEIGAQIADALDAAGKAGVIHQDVKPQNILVDESKPLSALGAPRVKLSDFGVGRVVDESVLQQITLTGGARSWAATTGSASESGTIVYMAPERLEGKHASPQSDLYSLGAVIYQMTAGDLNRPVTADWSRDIQDPLLREDLAGLLARDPAARPKTGAEIAQSLRSRAQRGRRRLVRRIAAIGAIVAAVLLVGALVLLWRLGESRNRQRELAGERDKARAERDRAEAAEAQA